ncbi:MAG: 50S ribosomal protein L16 [archaeon]
MGLRPGRCYSSTKDRAYTRYADKVQRLNYIGAIPGVKTRQFNMGNGLKEFDTILDLLTICGKDGLQIRDNAIESARLIINRTLAKRVPKEGYFLKVRIYPHHILRENKQAQGAGADRVSKGMSHCFGKPIGRAARIRNNQKIFSVLVMDEYAEAAKLAMLTAAARIPCGVRVRIGKDIESIGTKPKKIKEIKTKEEEEAEATAATAGEAGATEEKAAAPAAGKAGAKGAEAKKAEPEKKEAAKKEDKKK